MLSRVGSFFADQSRKWIPDSFFFRMFWIPAFAGVTDFGIFTRPSR